MRNTLPACDLVEFVASHSLLLFEKREIQLALLRCSGVSRREAMVLLNLTEWAILPLENELIRRGVLIDGPVEQREVRDGEAEDGQDCFSGGRQQHGADETRDPDPELGTLGSWREQPVSGG